MCVRPASAVDARAVATIYNAYVENTVVTFETQPVEISEMAARIAAVEASGLPWLVAEFGESVAGFAFATPWKPRSAYRHSVEITVYVAKALGGRGMGSMLYQALFSQLRRSGVHAAMAGIALPNPASVALHEKCGMKKVAHFSEVGFKLDRWVDVGYWQRVL
ncbi:MAG: GNAT family N-acetyltransferase [Gammaproteobacteria bacterium]